jgi:hypothetical protein
MKIGFYALLLFATLSKSVLAQIDFEIYQKNKKLFLSTCRDSVYSANAFKDSAFISDSTSIIDTSFQKDSLASEAPRDTIVPINIGSVLMHSEYGSVLNRGQINKLDYRFVGDLFSDLVSGYHFDLGQFGQPSEVTLYGLGFNNISYLSDGILQNNRLFNIFDLNHLQVEYIDSIEVIPLPRGFLYGPGNNPVSVNVITSDKIDPKPTTQIRFYQGVNNEAYIGALFNAYLMNRLNGTLDVTTSGVDSRYKNSEYESWIVSAKLKYLLSNKFNIIGRYKHVKTITGLNGGVDVDELIDAAGNVNVNLLFSSIQAPVEYGELFRYQKLSAHNFEINLLAKINKQSKSVLNGYYYFSSTEFRQNESGTLTGVPIIFHNNQYKLLGVNLKHNQRIGFLSGEIISNLESVNFTTPLINLNSKITHYSIAGRILAELSPESINASIFGKYLNSDGQSFTGAGADINLKFSDRLQIYSGASIFNKPLNPIEGIVDESIVSPSLLNYRLDDSFNTKTFEIGVKFNSHFISGAINYYHSNIEFLEPALLKISDTLKISSVGFYRKKRSEINGIGARFNIRYSKLLLSGNSNFNLQKDTHGNYQIPQTTFSGGLYYIDTLFSNNLNLKTGFNFRLVGNRDRFIYDFERGMRSSYIFDSATETLSLISTDRESLNYQFDFFLAGTIQDNAVIYFVWENLLGEDYYIVPFYPIQQRGIRIGLNWTLFN